MITSATPLNREQTSQISTYIAAHIADLRSDEPERISTARSRLLAPLERRGIGVPFRLAYSNALCPELEPLASAEPEIVAVNALRLLGEVATDRATNSLQTALDHPSPGIRYTGVYGLIRMYEAITAESPAVAPERCQALIGRLGEMIRNDPDPWILDACVRALIAAGAIDKPNFEALRAAAYTELASSVADRVRLLPMEEDGVDRLYFILRSTVATRDALSDRRSLSSGAARAVADLGGNVLAFAAARIDRGRLPDDERRLLVSLVSSSQATVFFAAGAIMPDRPTPPVPPALGDLVRERRDADFLRMSRDEIRKLYTDPYSFPAGRFDRP